MILLVGNGPISPDKTGIIDEANFVVRFNGGGSYEQLPGPTHALGVCNTGAPGRAMSQSVVWRSHAATNDTREIWCVRNPAKFLELRPTIMKQWPELSDFCDDYTPGFAAYAAANAKELVVFDRKIHDEVDADLSQLARSPYVVPSSGMLALHYALERFPGQPITLVGFSHQGWEWHPFSAERALVDDYVRAGKVRRL